MHNKIETGKPVSIVFENFYLSIGRPRFPRSGRCLKLAEGPNSKPPLAPGESMTVSEAYRTDGAAQAGAEGSGAFR